MSKSAKNTLLTLLLLLLPPLLIPAQRRDSLLDRNKLKYTKERPLIYEGAEDLWPYSFLGEDGEPDGFNIDLIKLILDKLNIPYEIRMKPRLMAFKDLREGRSDLMIGLTAGFHEEFAHYSDNPVTLFTQSVLSPRSKPTKIRNFRDLANQKVYVNDSSLCHHLMIDYGWRENALPTLNIEETIKQISANDEGELVWNTLSLKWIINKFHITNLSITPVNMPHGEYKFMSSDEHLIHLMDSVFSDLNAANRLVPLQNKWFYPERIKKEKETPQWVIYTCTAIAFVLLILLAYTVTYQLQAWRITRENRGHTERLSFILETCGVRIWTYDVATATFAWRNEHGQVAYTYSAQDFAHRYPPADFARLQEAIERLSNAKPGDNGYKEEEVTLQLKARDKEDGDNTLHDFTVRVSVLRRNADGLPVTLIGTKMDITDKQRQHQVANERTMRYKAVFNTPLMGVIAFDSDGTLTDINDRACQTLHCDHDKMVAAGVRKDELPERENPDIEFQFVDVHDDDKHVIGSFAICHNLADTHRTQRQHAETETVMEGLRRQLAEYDRDIDGVIQESDVRLVSYSTQSHTLRFFSTANEVKHTLSQTRCMSLANQRSEKLVMRTLDAMDHCVDRDIEANVLTNLRIKGGLQLTVQFNLTPLKDEKGNIIAYVGLCRDFSELRHIEQRMATETAKVQEVENAKNSFVNNMVQEINQPMKAIVEYVGQMKPEAPAPGEETIKEGIIDNAEKLVALIDKVLLLSRIEAHMVEITPQPCDYAKLFEAQCIEGWEKHRRAGVSYVVENPYKQLTVNIDSTYLGKIVQKIAANAAANTISGTVKARIEYMGRRLVIAIDDTGKGIPPQQLAQLQQPKKRATTAAKGLGLTICQELVKQMGGTMEINSEKDTGTTVYITIPCNAEAIKRRRN